MFLKKSARTGSCRAFFLFLRKRTQRKTSVQRYGPELREIVDPEEAVVVYGPAFLRGQGIHPFRNIALESPVAALPEKELDIERGGAAFSQNQGIGRQLHGQG